jgi:hypothetical protein
LWANLKYAHISAEIAAEAHLKIGAFLGLGSGERGHHLGFHDCHHLRAYLPQSCAWSRNKRGEILRNSKIIQLSLSPFIQIIIFFINFIITNKVELFVHGRYQL